jgi:hypothetical protein
MTYPYFSLYFSHRVFEGDINKLFIRTREEIDQEECCEHYISDQLFYLVNDVINHPRS